MPQYRRTGFTPNSVTFTNPGDFTDTAKGSVERKQKNIGDAKLSNASILLKLNRRRRVNPTTEGETCCVTPLYEDLAMTFASSGSVEGLAELQVMKDDMMYLVELWFEDMASGFVPLDLSPTLPATPTP